MKSFIRQFALVALMASAACNSQRAVDSTLPERAADITGTITRVQAAGGSSTRDVVLVEEIPGNLQSGGAKANITVSAATRVFESSGGELKSIAFPELRIGMRARAWFEWPVAESYPVQGTAAVIVVERS